MLPGLEVRMLQSDSLSHVSACELSETDCDGSSAADFVVVLLIGSKDSEELDDDYTDTNMHNNDNNNYTSHTRFLPAH